MKLDKTLIQKLDNNSSKLYAYALDFLGEDASPKDEAPDEYGCANSETQIIKKVLPDFSGSLSTAGLYNIFLSDKRFKKITDKTAFQPGDIIISPTGVKKLFENANMKNGHVGIVLGFNLIGSNNSLSGEWDIHYTLPTWIKKYRVDGGYRVYCFRLVG